MVLSRVIFVGLSALLAVACAGAPLVVPTFDVEGLRQGVGDAVAEVGDAIPPEVTDLPADISAELSATLDAHDIRLPAMPSNSSDICRALGTPGVGTLAAAGLKELIGSIAAGTEVGLVVGVLVLAVVHTCPVWEPHLTAAIDDLL